MASQPSTGDTEHGALAGKSCLCPMFRSMGTCYHTGYKPTLREEVKREAPRPRAVLRSERWVRERNEQ